MNWVHVVLGVVAGVVYSVCGWLKNVREGAGALPDEERIVEWIRDLGYPERRAEAVRNLAKHLYENYREYVAEAMSKFNPREFFTTVLEGLVIGLLMGLLNLPVDVAVSIAAQTGILTLTRKLLVILRP